jgi:hypothetical protein
METNSFQPTIAQCATPPHHSRKWVEAVLMVRGLAFLGCTIVKTDAVTLAWANGVNSFLWGVLVLKLSWNFILQHSLGSPLYDWISVLSHRYRSGHSITLFQNRFRVCLLKCHAETVECFCFKMRDRWIMLETMVHDGFARAVCNLQQAWDTSTQSPSDERGRFDRFPIDPPIRLALPSHKYAHVKTVFPTAAPEKLIMERPERTTSHDVAQTQDVHFASIGKRKGV